LIEELPLFRARMRTRLLSLGLRGSKCLKLGSFPHVVLAGAVIGAGSRLRGVIVDAAYRVPEGTVIERRGETGEPAVLSEHYREAARYAIAR
jgi:hypothetical protein